MYHIGFFQKFRVPSCFDSEFGSHGRQDAAKYFRCLLKAGRLFENGEVAPVTLYLVLFTPGPWPSGVRRRHKGHPEAHPESGGCHILTQVALSTTSRSLLWLRRAVHFLSSCANETIGSSTIGLITATAVLLTTNVDHKENGFEALKKSLRFCLLRPCPRRSGEDGTPAMIG